MNDVEHRTTKCRCPRTNGVVERMNRTLSDECSRVHGRTTSYTGIGKLQRNPGAFLHHRDFERCHQGYWLDGRLTAIRRPGLSAKKRGVHNF